MKPPPSGWPRISSALFYRDPERAIAWLCEAFGFEARLVCKSPAGDIEHSELVFGDGLIMVGASERTAGDQEPNQRLRASPSSTGGKFTQSLCVHVEEIEAHHQRACQAGAKIFRELKTDDYGEEYWADRGYGAYDLEGHSWWFIERSRNPGEPVKNG